MGAHSRRKGVNWERRACSVVATHTGHMYWRRAKMGERQYDGDILPLAGPERGIDAKMAERWFVECKATPVLRPKQLQDWKTKAIQDARGRRILLVVKLDGGLVLVFDSKSSPNLGRDTAFIYFASA